LNFFFRSPYFCIQFITLLLKLIFLLCTLKSKCEQKELESSMHMIKKKNKYWKNRRNWQLIILLRKLLDSLHISNKKLWQRCHCDIMAKGGYVSRVWGSSSERETDIKWNRKSK
jgi:hypothetical protein